MWGYNCNYNFAFSCKWLTIFHYNSNALPQPLGHNLICLGIVKLKQVTLSHLAVVLAQQHWSLTIGITYLSYNCGILLMPEHYTIVTLCREQ